MHDMEYQLARQVLSLANQITKNRNKHIKELNLTAEQADSLTFFSGGSKGISDLRDYLHISHQTAQGIVKRMEEKNLIRLSVSATDGRCKTVSLTPKGEHTMACLRRNGTYTGSRLLFDMTPQQQEQFAALIEKALHNLQ